MHAVVDVTATAQGISRTVIDLEEEKGSRWRRRRLRRWQAGLAEKPQETY
jgi:hypothetical protein